CSLRLAELTSDAGERLGLLEQASSAAVKGESPALLARARAALGDFYAGKRERNAQAAWRAALEAYPDYFPAALRLGELWADQGLDAAAEPLVGKMANRFPQVRRIATGYAQLLERRGKKREAEAIWASWSAFLPRDPGLL